MFKQGIIGREFNAFSPTKDSSLKYVLSLDSVDMPHNGVVVVQSHLSGFAQNNLSSIDEVSIEVFSYVWNSNHLLTK